ncbi:tetratricopeptide repeat protein [Campylobacter fetus]|uniref:tetratricopeptide repeat protein n=1 Tax=Campylobacter fetus TaxID=196 RepID=UPI00168CF723|nr:hypothetical protein [Campylobacter fetus]MBD3866239.1 hypothetical protein [Campylobacter fetus]
MYWCRAALIFTLFLAGCADKQSFGAKKNETFFKYSDINTTIDLEAMKGFYLLGDAKSKDALEVFYMLYKTTKKPIFLKEALKIAFVIKDDRLDELITDAREILNADYDVIRIEIGYYILKSQIKDAKDLALNLIQKESNNSINHSILATIYLFNDEPIRALKEFKKAYEIEGSEENLLKLVDMLDNKLDRTNEAIRYLNNWIGENGCSKPVCFTLLNIYSAKGELDLMIEVYIKLYEAYEESDFLNRALEILLYKKDVISAKELLEKYSFNEPILMEIYAELKEFQKAYNVAQDLYNRSQNPEYMARMAIYKYEQSSKNISKFELDMVVKLFEGSVYALNSPIYFNYYGYLLIDYEIDLKKGLDIAKKAYILDPNSPYIIDSIAWGYFKLGECKEAKMWMDKIQSDTKFMKEDEAKAHKTAIDKCFNKGTK